jgi:hypothetical protein
MVNGVMLKSLPYRDGDRFVVLLSSTLNDPEHYGSLLSKDAETYEQRTRVFDAFRLVAGIWTEPHVCRRTPSRARRGGEDFAGRQLGVNPVFGSMVPG